MSKVTLLAAVLLLCAGLVAAADSPVDKGSLYLNGSVFFTSRSGDLWESDGESVTTLGVGNANIGMDGLIIDITPTIGYFVAPGFFVGGQMAVNRYSLGESDLTVIAVGPTLGYYFNAASTRPEVRGSAYPYVRGFFTFSNFSNGNGVTVLQYGGKGGILYMLSRAVGADLAVQFRGDRWDSDYTDNAETGTTLSVGLGFTAFIY